MKIATYNVNGIKGRLPVLLRWLAEAKPDVVCLQELKCPSGLFPEKELLEAGYYAVWQGQKSWNGVAILATEKIKETRHGLDGDASDEQSRYIEGFVFGLVIGCIYLPNGNPAPGPKLDYKLKWFERLNLHAKKLLTFNRPVLLIGDYNVIPTEIDTYKPEKYLTNALFLPESKLAYQQLLKLGWTDAIRHLYPTERIYTFYDYMRRAYDRDAGLRIDHFLLNDKVLKRLLSAKVDKHVRGWEKSSDHCPVWIEISVEDSN
ncbi:exodeoxyribonuclease-3 [Pedobacter sp. UYP30]|uniref:exodeoxyribonuclease III n=1 Tax=Pedobacter sp. UYP30 TaxID=1756400 RepID=UPI00339590BA